MIYPVTIIGHPTLRKIAQNITKDYPNLNTIIDNMFETMYSSDGVGLAAPQINKSIRIVVVDGTPMSEEDEDVIDFKKVFINAKITKRYGEETLFSEGCLSIPGIHEDIKRPSIIEMTYLDENFVEHNETFSGTQARIIQHEYDHLEGILFTDRVSQIRKKLLKSKLTAISKGKFKANYRTILAK